MTRMTLTANLLHMSGVAPGDWPRKKSAIRLSGTQEAPYQAVGLVFSDLVSVILVERPSNSFISPVDRQRNGIEPFTADIRMNCVE